MNALILALVLSQTDVPLKEFTPRVDLKQASLWDIKKLKPGEPAPREGFFEDTDTFIEMAKEKNTLVQERDAARANTLRAFMIGSVIGGVISGVVTTLFFLVVRK